MADNQKLDRHNFNIHSQTPSWLPVFSKSFVLFCFFNSMKRCLLITRWDRVATRCSSSSGACWWQWGGLVLCAAAASVEWMQMRHHRYALGLHASNLFWGPEGTPPSCTFHNVHLAYHMPADRTVALFDYRHAVRWCRLNPRPLRSTLNAWKQCMTTTYFNILPISQRFGPGWRTFDDVVKRKRSWQF